MPNQSFHLTFRGKPRQSDELDVTAHSTYAMPKPKNLAVTLMAALFIPMAWVSVAFDVPGQPLFLGMVVGSFVVAEVFSLWAAKQPRQQYLEAYLAEANSTERITLSVTFRLAALLLSIGFGFAGFSVITQSSGGDSLTAIIFLLAAPWLLWLAVTGKAPAGRFWR